ncbi:WD repeat-containing protein 13-like isoform X2 [Daktulosphaira vitifoliae]|uniref:WD repeat-containing protein 13-like isoform X2 n=1 Tax=Daktulosphaira vitifoliae TaxID=58002 RepID=UPI0021A9EDB4|nr:WD repeat-containing protein 13-like isoform X2 [Daktulosphaira vitifoliae]
MNSTSTLYIRRRSQLLREKSKQDGLMPFNNLRRKYLKIRSSILQNKYNVNLDGQSNSTSSLSTSMMSLNMNASPLDIDSSSHIYYDLTPIPTSQAKASRALVGNNTIEENYAFDSVYHIYDQHSDAVTVLKFANNDKSKLCCASNDGTLSICDVLTSPPSVLAILKYHSGPVTGCDWSASDEFIASCSTDATICFWDAIHHCCLRCVDDPFLSSVLVCVFNPVNNNILITGNKAGFVCVLNVSTGMYPKGGKHKIGGQILSLAVDSSGQIIWAGNNKGEIVSLKLNSSDGSVLTKCHRIIASQKFGAVTCLSWRSWISREARDPMLLANCSNNMLCLYNVSENVDGLLILKKKFLVSHMHSKHLLRSTFCPIMSFRQGACVVTSSEDSCVYFVDIERESNYAVNKLQGHACVTLGVTFNYDETMLATSDIQGIIIIWSRQSYKQNFTH